MASIDPYAVGADSISARGALLAAPSLRAGIVRPYLQFSLDLSYNNMSHSIHIRK